MNSDLLMYLKDRIEIIEQNNRDDHKHIIQRLEKLDQFKWKIIGGTIVISMCATILFQLGVLWVTH